MSSNEALVRAASLGNRLASEFSEYAQPRSPVAPTRPETDGLSPLDDWLVEYDRRITDEQLRDATRSRFVSQHYADAVESGVKGLNECVRQRSGSNLDGDALMTAAFSGNSPRLRIPERMGTKNAESEQRGHMMLCQGVVAAWRNPRAHTLIDDDADKTIMMLELIQHLMTVTRQATKTRSRK